MGAASAASSTPRRPTTEYAHKACHSHTSSPDLSLPVLGTPRRPPTASSSCTAPARALQDRSPHCELPGQQRASGALCRADCPMTDSITPRIAPAASSCTSRPMVDAGRMQPRPTYSHPPSGAYKGDDQRAAPLARQPSLCARPPAVTLSPCRACFAAEGT